MIERLGCRLWRSDLEVTRRMIGLLTKVQLCVFGSLTKEVCIATYLFCQWVYRFRRKSRWLSLGLYLKAANVCLMRYYSHSFEKNAALPHPISLTRSGIPRCIPSFHRRMISRRDEKADKLVRLYLSFFTISKLILVSKKSTHQYSSIVDFCKAENLSKLIKEITDLGRSMIERYVPRISEIPLKIGLSWKPSWAASPIPYRFVPGRIESPFHRMIWDLFSVVLWDKANLLGWIPMVHLNHGSNGYSALIRNCGLLCTLSLCSRVSSPIGLFTRFRRSATRIRFRS